MQSILNDPAGPVIQKGPYGPSFDDWNIVVGLRRGGQYHAWINGVQQPPGPYTGMEACATDRRRQRHGRQWDRQDAGGQPGR